MKTYKRFAVVVTILALHSCSNGMEEGNNASSTNTIAAPPPTIQPQTAPQQTTTTTAAGLNPPHGQPGHRCDISVGAPLNSKPSTPTVTTTAPQQQTVVMPQPTAPAAATTTAAGKNPPHGQPGHRCDIAVGAPLPK